MSNEIKGVGNSYTAEFWEYDPRLGRRWNIDPVNVGEISPYQTFAKNPIVFVDPYGLDTVNSSRSAQVGDVFKHRNKNSNFYWNKTEEGWEGGGSSESLAGVTVTAKIKGGGRNYLNYPASTKIERMQWNIDQRNYRLGDYSNLSQAQIARYQNWDITESNYRSLSYIFVGCIAAPVASVVALEIGIVVGTDAFLWKMGLDGEGQMIVNSFDISRLDIFDMTLAGFSAPGASAFYGGAIDFRLNGQFNMVGINKSWQTDALDGTFKYAFGGQGLGSVPGNMLNKLTYSTNLSKFEKDLVLRLLSIPINVTGKLSRKIVKQETGL